MMLDLCDWAIRAKLDDGVDTELASRCQVRPTEMITICDLAGALGRFAIRRNVHTANRQCFHKKERPIGER